MTSGRPLSAKLFLEGIEIPFTGASVTNTVNQASIAYIDLVPHSAINNIKPRTLAHLFVRDVNDEKGGYPYVLAFKGEVFGVNFSKSPTSRSFSISCIDNSSYWDNVLSYFFNPLQSLGKGADQIGAEARDISDVKNAADGAVKVTHSTSSYYKRVMDKAFAEIEKSGRLPDLLDGLVAIYKDIGDVNDFYKLTEERLRITDRIVSASSGELAELLKHKEAMDWLMGIVDGHSGFTSLRMVVNDLMGILFHDFASISFPALVTSPTVKTGLIPGTSTTIGEFLFKPHMYMIAPPTCNIFFPDEYSSFTYSRNFMTEPTRLIYKPMLPTMAGAGLPGVSLPHVYEPESFNHYMMKKGQPMPNELTSNADTHVTADPGHFDDADIVDGKPRESTNGKKREQNFLTNEERYKGIILSQESMVPAASAFRAHVDDASRAKFSQEIAKYMFHKKKFETRQIQITSHLKMSVVPGFTTLVLDDSSAGQNIMAYCSSVTHRIYCNQGGYTNTTLAYARTIDEQDTASGKSGEPLIPPWFKKDIFGEKKVPAKSSDKEINAKVSAAGEQIEVPDALSDYFAKLLGEKGSQSINSYTKEKTMMGATYKLINEYKVAKKRGGEAVFAMIDKLTRRRYIRMDEAFRFLGASPVGGTSKDNQFLEYNGERLFGGGDTADAPQLKARREVIRKYRNALRESRGFRG